MVFVLCCLENYLLLLFSMHIHTFVAFLFTSLTRHALLLFVLRHEECAIAVIQFVHYLSVPYVSQRQQ